MRTKIYVLDNKGNWNKKVDYTISETALYLHNQGVVEENRVGVRTEARFTEHLQSRLTSGPEGNLPTQKSSPGGIRSILNLREHLES